MRIDQTNISVYKSLYQHKALTEKIIGATDYAFKYAVASYKAVCTEGVDFTMFDKVICGILQIDEVSSFEEIADILGLNVVHRPEQGKYIDFGEKEILDYAIKSLIDFNMVETDDIYYSRCRLTEIGKDYAKQGKKFLPATPKEFKIYYDLTDQKHQEAKKRFGKLTGVRQPSSLNFEVADEAFVKEVAKTQTPEIYNPNLLRNFTSLDLRAIDVFEVTFKVVGLVSIKDNSVRFLAFDDKQILNQSISDIIEENIAIKNEILKKLLAQYEPVASKKKSDFQKQYEREITEQQQEIEDLLSHKQGEKAFIKIKEIYSKSSIIEEQYFDLNFKEFFDESSKEFWIIVSQLNQHLFNEIKEIIERKVKIENNVFIIAQSDISQEASQYFTQTATAKPNIFWGAADEIEETIILSKNGNDKKAISRQPILLGCQTDNGLKHFEQNAYFQTNEWSDDISEIYKQCKPSIAQSYCQIVHDKVEKEINEFMQNPTSLTKQKIENLEAYSGRLRVFRNEKDFAQWINEFYKISKEKITALKKLLIFKIETEVKDIESSLLVEEANFSISEFREFEDKLQELKTNLYDENTEGGIKIKNLEDLIQPKIQALSKLEKKSTSKPQNQKTNSFKNKK
jgi:hypothetical protein